MGLFVAAGCTPDQAKTWGGLLSQLYQKAKLATEAACGNGGILSTKRNLAGAIEEFEEMVPKEVINLNNPICTRMEFLKRVAAPFSSHRSLR